LKASLFKLKDFYIFVVNEHWQQPCGTHSNLCNCE